MGFQKFLVLAVLLSAAGMVSSCTTMSKDECTIADWQAVGVRDGTNGRPYSYFSEHVSSCKKTTAIPNQTLWQQGHEIGARRYCTPENGLRAGNAGKTYHNICPIDLQAEFIPAYQLGKERYQLLQRRNSKASQIQSNISRINDLERRVRKGKADKSETRRETRSLRHENRDLRYEIEDLEADIARLDRRIRFEGLSPPPAPTPIY